MMPLEVADRLNTPENRDAYRRTENKSLFIQELIEGLNIETWVGSPLCDYVEDTIVSTIAIDKKVGNWS